MELGGGFRVKSRGRFRGLSGMNVRLDSELQVVIELPASWVLHYVLISAFFAVVILTLPLIGLILNNSFGNCFDGVDSELMSSFELVEALIEDLSEEGLMTEVDKALIVGAGSVGDIGEGFWFRSGNELHLAEESHLVDHSLIPDETYDFALVSSSLDAKSVDRVMKVGGIVAVQLMIDSWNEFMENSNYKIVYLRTLEPAVMAARKIRPFNPDKRVVSPTTRRLFEVIPEAKEASSRDSLLGSPGQDVVGSREYSSRINYQPGDFIKSGWTMVDTGITHWFYESFPMRNLPFLHLPRRQMNSAEDEEHAATKTH